MQRNKSITRYKQKLLIFLSALFIALILQPKQTVYADVDYAAWAASIVNMIGTSNAGGTAEIQNGVTYQRTGYLCYLLTKDGADTGLPAVAFKSPGFNYLSGYNWIATSRRGHTVTTFEGGEAPWGVTPWAEGGVPTHAPEIRAWFQGMDNNNNENGVKFIVKNWGEEAATHYYNGEYIIVVETLMHFQFSKPTASISASSFTGVAAQMIRKLYDDDELYDEAVKKGYILDDANSISSAITTIKKDLVDALAERLAESVGSDSARSFVGPPLIGTVPNLIDYKISTDPSMTVFDSYLNKVAPFAERIEYDEAGFIAYTGGTSSQIPNADVKNYGLAMLIIHANSDMQTTCNEPAIPSPHEPPKESEGKVTIVKSYRTKDPTGALIDDGTYSLGDLGTQILIENEQVYQVIGWKTSTTTNTGISSINWNPPSTVIQYGTTPKSVTLEPAETCLYVLLEKVEDPEVEEMEWNYHLTQSQITRTVWFSNPDRPLDNMGSPFMYEREITWIAPAHQECHEHYYWTACDSKHSCSEVNCKVLNCPDDGSHDCGDDCVKNTEYCTGWKWKPGTEYLKLSINNTLQESYPDILATKVGWNVESRKGELTKHHYLNDSQFLRESETMQTYTDTGWDYVCVLLRGKDKLTVAQWQNDGEGNNAKNDATTDLDQVSPSGFTIANTDSGTRKTVDYFETFNTTFKREEHGVEGTDNETVWYPTIPAPVTGELCADDPRYAYVAPPLHINDIVVKVETYSGTASEHKNDTTCDDRHLTHDLPDYNTSSGRMVKSGSIVSFTPYIEMKYDTLDKYDKQAFVLSEFTAQLTPNDYGELSWNRTTDSNLSLISAQWSTHADACKDWGADNVLPGGATLSLNIKKEARQEVAVTTWQCILEGTGKTHVEKTGGSYGNLTRENAVSAHQSFVATVQAALESTNVQQYVEKNPNKSDAFGGLEVNPGVNISSLGTGAKTASTELKYYFRDDNTDSPSNEGDLDVNDLGTSQETYTFFACTHGHIHLSVGNTSPKISECNCSAYPIAKSDSIGQLINKRTLIIDKLEAALEQGTGSDGTIHSGPKWYNEAFDGITVIMQQTILEVGYNDPPERSSVLDPKLTPKQTSQKSLFSKYFLSQFKTQDHSAYYNEPYIMGEFKNAKVKLKDMDYLFHSRKFWIPNATTQDLH